MLAGSKTAKYIRLGASPSPDLSLKPKHDQAQVGALCHFGAKSF